MALFFYGYMAAILYGSGWAAPGIGFGLVAFVLWVYGGSS